MGQTARYKPQIVVITRIPNLGIWGRENYFMCSIVNYTRSIFLVAAIATPGLLAVQAKAQEMQVRVYDRDHHDYHNWDAHEDRVYRHYLIEHHRTYVIYSKQHHDWQRHYWDYRHQYPDRY
jgi:hypothetical protein